MIRWESRIFMRASCSWRSHDKIDWEPVPPKAADSTTAHHDEIKAGHSEGPNDFVDLNPTLSLIPILPLDLLDILLLKAS